MSKEQTPAATDRCALCNNIAANHFNYGVGGNLWCNKHRLDVLDCLDVFTPKAGAEATGKSDPVEQYKERLKAAVTEENVNIWQRLPPDIAKTAGRYCDWFLKLIDEL